MSYEYIFSINNHHGANNIKTSKHIIYIKLLNYLAFQSVDYERIIHPVASVSEMTWFMWYIYTWNLQLLNGVIYVPQVYVTLTDFGVSAWLLFNTKRTISCQEQFTFKLNDDTMY